jgi:hypothetical protein
LACKSEVCVQFHTGVKLFRVAQYGVYTYTLQKFNLTIFVCMKMGCAASEYVYTLSNLLQVMGWRQVWE